MGQPVQVRERQSQAVPRVYQYETNRPLSGMGHRHYSSAADALSEEDPADELATRLFERGGIEGLHVQGSVITVDIERTHDSAGITEIIEDLFSFYDED